MKFTNFIFLILAVLLFHNCEKESFENNNNNDSEIDVNDANFQSEYFGNEITGNFIGLVTDTSNEKLQGVEISIGNKVVLTDRNGVFVINNADVYENFAYVKAQKNGYINGSRVVIPKTDGVNKIHIVLLDKQVTATINSGEPSEVVLNDSKVRFSGSFVNSNGDPYQGQVDVVLHYVAPNFLSTFTQMPGSLFARSATNSAVNLETYGMLSVSLFSPSGETLDIDENNPAVIEFPVYFSQTSIAPDTIPLWYFDEEVGYWKEEGQAIKEGNKYVGEVSHFSWWNCDLPIEYVELCVSLSTTDIASPTSYLMEIERNSNQQTVFIGNLTSYAGIECGLVPKNEQLTVSIYSGANNCFGQLLHQQVIGGYSSNATEDISFSGITSEIITTAITGTVTNCEGVPLTDGYVFIDNYNTFSITDGMIDLALQHCGALTTTVQIFDFDSSQWVIVYDVPLEGNGVNLGALGTCEDTGGIYNGDVTLTTQDEIDDFGAFNYSGVDGDLLIGTFNTTSGSDIVDLTPLSSLETVSNMLIINYNDDLQNLEGLNNLTELSTFRITNNASLISMVGLNNLNTIGNLYIENNQSLVSLDGLEGLDDLDSITLINNNSFNSLVALSNLSSTIRFITIDGNPSLTTLVGLEQTTDVIRIWIMNNLNLNNLNGLENVISLDELNSVFSTIKIGLRLQDDQSYTAAPNPNLTDLCALQNLIINGNGSSVAYKFFIDNNGYNPTVTDIANGNCSL